MLSKKLVLSSMVSAALLATNAYGSSTCTPDGVQGSGSIYRICMPDPSDYNGNLVLWAHGFQDAGTPVQIPEDQLHLDTIYLPQLMNDLGFGFATNSYSKTGLAVRQGMADLIDLVEIYTREQGAPRRIFLIGASEGGIITTLLAEQHPDIVDGGVAACGPVGSFPLQINYFGDARATFEAFFPGLIPGDPFNPTPELAEGWEDYYENEVRPVVMDRANSKLLFQWVRVARLPFDPKDYRKSVEVSVADALRYSVVNLNDAAQTLGGFPYGNRFRFYTGSANDLLLNLLVPRVSLSPAALTEMTAFYDTTGGLSVPLVTLHTLLDQQVPYFHEQLYLLKTISTGSFLRQHINIPVERFEHCNFTSGEALLSFTIMLLKAGETLTAERIAAELPDEQQAKLRDLAQGHGLALP